MDGADPDKTSRPIGGVTRGDGEAFESAVRAARRCVGVVGVGSIRPYYVDATWFWRLFTRGSTLVSESSRPLQEHSSAHERLETAAILLESEEVFLSLLESRLAAADAQSIGFQIHVWDRRGDDVLSFLAVAFDWMGTGNRPQTSPHFSERHP